MGKFIKYYGNGVRLWVFQMVFFSRNCFKDPKITRDSQTFLAAVNRGTDKKNNLQYTEGIQSCQVEHTKFLES